MDVQTKKDELAALVEEEDGEGLPKRYLQGNVKSKARTVLKWIKARRPGTEYNGPEYDCLDTLFAMVAPYCVNPDVEDTGKVWCWPRMDGVYSQEVCRLCVALDTRRDTHV